MRGDLELFVVGASRLNRELQRRLATSPALNYDQLARGLSVELSNRDLKKQELEDSIEKMFPRSAHRKQISAVVAAEICSDLPSVPLGVVASRLGVSAGKDWHNSPDQRSEGTLQKEICSNLVKVRVIALLDWIVQRELNKKELYGLEKFSLERMFRLISCGEDAITTSTVKDFFGPKLDQVPSVLADTLEILRKGSSKEKNPFISLKEFRLAVTPTIHYLDALSINEDDRFSLDTKNSSNTHSVVVDRDSNEEDYKLVEINRPIFLTGSHQSESLENSPYQREFSHLRYIESGSPKQRQKKDFEPGAPLSKKYKQEEPEWDSLEKLKGKQAYDDDRCLEYADYPVSTGSRDFKSPQAHIGVDQRFLQAPYKDSKAIYNDNIKRDITRKINFSEENYWNAGHLRNEVGSKQTALLAAPVVRENLILDSPVFLGGKNSKQTGSHLKTTLPKEDEGRPIVSENKNIHRQISFENLEII